MFTKPRIVHFMFTGAYWCGYRLARAFTTSKTRHVKHVTIALVKKPAKGTPGEGKVDRWIEDILWELREGTADTVAGLTNSVKLVEGKWRIIDNILWPYHSTQYKTATFPAPVELNKDKVYFLVVKMMDESGNADILPVWCGEDSTTTNCSYTHHPFTGWVAFSPAIDLWIWVPDDQAGVKYHAVVDGRGFMSPDKLASYNTQLATQFGGTLRGGQSRHSQLAYPYSSFSQDTFRHGMGWTYFEDPQTFLFGYNVDARVEGQVILSPRTLPAALDGILAYHITKSRYDIGLPWREHSLPQAGMMVREIAQQVWVSSANHTLKGVWLWIRKEWLQNYVIRNLTFKLYDHNAGTNQPGNVVRTVDITAYAAMKWHDLCLVKIEFTEYGVLPLNEYVWLSLTVSDTGSNEGPMYSVSVDPTASFTQSGKTTRFMYKRADEWFEDTNYDLQFFLNFGAFPAGDAFFVEYNNTVFVAAGPSIYGWDEVSKKWYVVVDGSTFGGDVTGLVGFAGYLWAAWGSKHVVMRSVNGWTSWTDVAGQYAGLFFLGRGYLWKSDPSAPHKIHYTNDGTTWSAAIEVGTSDTKITGFCLFNDVVVVSKENGLWYVDSDFFARSYFDYQDQKHPQNGINLKVWSNNVYIPILSGLWRWTGSTVDTLGPDRGAGMPQHFEGRIRDIVSCANWMFVAVDAGSTGWSQVLCYNGIGWLPFVRAQHFGSPIRRIFLTSGVGNELRLWIMEDKSCYYLALPWTRENHFEWEYGEFQADGTLITSWWNGGLFNAVKYFKDITLEVDGLVKADDGIDLTWVDVWYQIDGTENLLGPLYYLGRIVEGSPQTLKFGKDLVAFSIRFIFKLGSRHSEYTPRIKSYNVDCIVRPDPSFVTSLALSVSDYVKLMDKTESPYTAEELWNFLKVAQAKAEPIIINLPWGTIYGFISALQSRTQQYKEMGVPTWEQVAVMSIVEA